MSEGRELSPAAHALTALRVLKNGEGRQYTATTFPRDPRSGCETFIRRALGNIGRWPHDDEPYAILDVLNVDGDIVQDFPLPDARAFRWVKKRLNLKVADA